MQHNIVVSINEYDRILSGEQTFLDHNDDKINKGDRVKIECGNGMPIFCDVGYETEIQATWGASYICSILNVVQGY